MLGGGFLLSLLLLTLLALPARSAGLPRPLAQAGTPTLGKFQTPAVSPPGYAAVGETITYTLRYTIPAGTGIEDVLLTDVLPDPSTSVPDVQFVPGSWRGPFTVTAGTPSVAPVTPTISADQRALTWTLQPISNTSSISWVYEVVYQAVVNDASETRDGRIAQNTATLSWAGGSTSAQSSLEVVEPNMRVENLSASPSEVSPGGLVTITFRINNRYSSASSPAYDVVVTVTLPAWLRYEGGTASPAPTITSPHTIIWQAPAAGGAVTQLISIPVNSPVYFSFVARLTDTVVAGLELPTTVEASGTSLPGVEAGERTRYSATNGSRYYESDTTGGNELYALRAQVSKVAVESLNVAGNTPTDARVLAGEVVTYTVTITVPQGTRVYTATLDDYLDDGLRWGGVVGSTPAPDAVTQSGDDTLVTWNLGNVDASVAAQVITRSYRVTVAQRFFYGSDGGEDIEYNDTLRNRADLNWQDVDGSTADLQTPSAVRISLNFLRPQFEFTKVSNKSDPHYVGSGEVVTFTVTIRNRGDWDAFDIVLTDTLAAGLSLITTTPPYSGVTGGGSVPTVITWGVAVSLPAGSYMSTDYTIVATVPLTMTAGQRFTNTIAAMYSAFSGTPAYDVVYTRTVPGNIGEDENYSTVRGGMVLSKTFSPPGYVEIGQVVTYTIYNILYPGTIAYWPEMYDDLPLGFHYLSGTFSLSPPSITHTTPITEAGSNNRERVRWQMSTFDNLTGTDYLTVTCTFQAVQTGRNYAGTEQWVTDNNQRGQLPNDSRAQNQVTIQWHVADTSTAPYDDSQSYTVPSSERQNVEQPYLEDYNGRDFQKELVGGGPSIAAGDILTYVISLYNQGWGNAYDILITDTLPPGLVFQSTWARATSPPTVTFSLSPTLGDTGVITWVVDRLDGKESSSGYQQLFITYTVLVSESIGAGDPTSPYTLTNTAALGEYTSQPGDDPHERRYSLMPNITMPDDDGPALTAPAAEIAKSASVTQVVLGGSFVYTLTVPAAPTKATLYNLVVVDRVPDPLWVTGVSAPGGSVNATADTVTVTYASLYGDPSTAIVITVTVPATATGGTITDQATMTWDDVPGGGSHSDTSNSVDVTIIAPELVIHKEAPLAVLPGQTLVYTIIYSNTGTAPALDVTIADHLPFSVTYQSWSSSPPITLTSGPNPLAWDAGTLGVGEGGTIWITVSVPSTVPLGTALVNTATIATSSAGDSPDNNVVTTTTGVGGAVFQVQKTDSPDPTWSGGEITYRLVVTNVGVSAAQNTVISDTVPPSTTLLAVSSGGSYAGTTPGSLITWSVGSLAVNASAQVTFAVRVDAPPISGTFITNADYGVTADNRALPPSVPPVTTTIAEPVLSIGKAAVPDPVEAGEELLYTLTVINSGPVPAMGLVVSDVVPVSTTFRSASDGGTLVGGVVVWSPSGSLAANGGTAQFTFTVRVDSPLVSGTQIANTTYVVRAGNAQAPVLGQPVSVTVHSQPLLSLAKQENADPIPPGLDLVYTVRYENTGNAVARDVLLREEYPAEVSFVAASPAPDVGNDTWHLGNLPLEARTVVITVHVPATLPLGTVLTNTVTLSSAETAPQSVTITTTVGNAPVLHLSKADAPDPVQPGDLLTYTLHYANEGTVTATNVVLTESYDAHVSFVSAIPAPDYEGGEQWTLGSLGVGEEGTVVVVVQVASPLTNGLILRNRATLLADGVLPAVAEAETTVQSAPRLQLHKAAPGIVEAGDYLTYTITYANTGNETATGLVITETYPPSVTFVSAIPAPDGGTDNVWSLGNLAVGAGGTLTVVVQADPALPDDVFLVNTVTIDSQQTEPIQATAHTKVGFYRAHLPLVLKGYQYIPPRPDLVVQDISVDPAQPVAGEPVTLTVTIANVGQVAITDRFWVDLYIDPDPAGFPITVNKVWNDLCQYGIAWYVYISPTDPLEPGETLVLDSLHPDDPTNPDAIYSYFPGTLAVGDHTLYALVDSWNEASSLGLIVEADEGNNLLGPVVVTVGVTSVHSLATPTTVPLDVLPRPTVAPSPPSSSSP